MKFMVFVTEEGGMNEWQEDSIFAMALWISKKFDDNKAQAFLNWVYSSSQGDIWNVYGVYIVNMKTYTEWN